MKQGAPQSSQARVILIATGSELQLAVEARNQLAEKDVVAYVVSMPCVEWFESQPKEYRDSVLPPEVSARSSGGRRRAELAQAGR